MLRKYLKITEATLLSKLFKRAKLSALDIVVRRGLSDSP